MPIKKKVNEIVNLTKHEIVLGDLIIKPSGEYIRVDTKRELIEVLEYQGSEIPVYKHDERFIDALPERKDGRIYLVSYKAADIAERDDFYKLDEQIRGDNGRTIGAMSLSVSVAQKREV